MDWEGAVYTLMSNNATARAALTETVVTLKAKMEARVPGSILAVWIDPGGSPWTDDFTADQLQAAFGAVDYFYAMDYSACGWPYSGMANAPTSWVERGQARLDSLGFPKSKIVHVFPWHSCDFNCGTADNPLGGVNCSHLRPREYCADGKTLCTNNITTRGYAQTLPFVSLGRSQGFVESFNASEGANHINWLNESSGEYHEIWYDDPSSLRRKYAWSQSVGSGGVGMWVPSATLFNVSATKAMWDAVPSPRDSQ